MTLDTLELQVRVATEKAVEVVEMVGLREEGSMEEEDKQYLTKRKIKKDDE